MKKFLLVLSLSILLSSCFSNKPKDELTRQEVFAIIDDFDNAWQSKDREKTEKILDSSYIYFTQSGGSFSRDSIIATAGSPSYQLDFSDRIIDAIHINGNTAIVSTRWTGKGSYRGQPFDDTQRCSVTIIKQNGVVRILSEHCTSISY